uniref:Uncharacterized protein n=1 Tax=Myotis myotis TaxID=51298 RepID=A0A7J7Z5E0_MYOMY|nr:hypothetical protein mMyoMyo1_010807 [Myotis myotis]
MCAPCRKFGQGRKRHGRGNCSSSSQESSGHICANRLPLPWIPSASGFGCLQGALGWARYPPGASILSCQLLLSGPQPPSSVRGWGGGGREPGTLQHGPEAGPSPRADQSVDGKGALHMADSKHGDGGYGEAFSTQDRAEGVGGTTE